MGARDIHQLQARRHRRILGTIVRSPDCGVWQGPGLHGHRSIAPGADFIKEIERTVAACDAVLVVIGRQWLTVVEAQGRRRIETPRISSGSKSRLLCRGSSCGPRPRGRRTDAEAGRVAGGVKRSFTQTCARSPGHCFPPGNRTSDRFASER
jgi:hypothetical protein